MSPQDSSLNRLAWLALRGRAALWAVLVQVALVADGSFNHVVGMERVKVRNPITKAKEWWANVLCWGTGFQQVRRLGANSDDDDSKAAESFWGLIC